MDEYILKNIFYLPAVVGIVAVTSAKRQKKKKFSLRQKSVDVKKTSGMYAASRSNVFIFHAVFRKNWPK